MKRSYSSLNFIELWSPIRTMIVLLFATVTVLSVIMLADLSLITTGITGFVKAPLLLLAFGIAYAGAFYLRAIAWNILSPSLGQFRAFSILHVSLFANHAAPVKVGEIIRPALSARLGISKTESIVSSITCRALDFICLLIIVAALVPLGFSKQIFEYKFLSDYWQFIAIFSCVLAFVITELFVSTQLFSKPRALLLSYISQLGQYPFRKLLNSSVVTMLSWILEGSVVYIAAASLGLDVALTVAVAATAFTLLFQVFHVTPGGIGVYEAAMTAVLVAFGISPAEALSIAVLAHGMKFLYSFSVGLVFTLIATRSSLNLQLSIRPLRLFVSALFLIQFGLILGFFYDVLSALTVTVIDISLLILAISSVLFRQWLGAWRPLKITTDSIDLSGPIVVVIPAYNEAKILPHTISRISRGVVDKIIVVDEGSTDGTADIAESLGVDYVIRHSENRGLGAALRTALEASKDFNPLAVVYVDADGEYDPAEIDLLIKPILNGKADYVLGSRTRGSRTGQLISRKIANKIFTVLLQIISGRRISDGQTGFRAFSSRALFSARIIHDYNYAQVLTLNLLRQRMRLYEVPITWTRRSVGVSFIRPEYLWRVPLGVFRELVSR